MLNIQHKILHSTLFIQLKWAWHNAKIWAGFIEVGYFILPGRKHICRQCRQTSIRNDKYDLYACHNCDLWLEPFCRVEPSSYCFPTPTVTPNGLVLGAVNPRTPYKNDTL